MFDFMFGGFAGLRAAAASANSGLREPNDKLVEENRAVFDIDDENTIDDTPGAPGIANEQSE